MADRHMHEAWADEHEHEHEHEHEEEEEEEGLDDMVMPPDESAQEFALRVAEAARARGLPPGAAGSAMQALLRKLGGGGLDDVTAGGNSMAGRLKSCLSGLRAEGDDSAQMEALTSLCEILSMSSEEALACAPPYPHFQRHTCA